MSLLALHVGDWFFLVFHTAFTLFNLVGWMFHRTRRLHLICIVLTAISWFFFGLFYGIGYCFCTDWHFQILTALGEKDLPLSYITYIIERWSGFRPDDGLVIQLTGVVFAVVAIATIAVNIRVERRVEGS